MNAIKARAFSTCRALLKDKEVPRKLFGRPSNNLKGGIVGLANVGKSTFFQAITESKLGNPANYPFATIDPEEAKCIVPSTRFDRLCAIYRPEKQTPASMTLFDIAGLIKGAGSENLGLGNRFLAEIRQVDGLFQVVRAFEDADVIHVEETVDAVRDLQIIHDELVLKDMEFAMKYVELCERGIKRGSGMKQKELQKEHDIAKRVLAHLETGKRVLCGEWSNDDIDVINQMALLTSKPSVYLVNISEDDYLMKDFTKLEPIQKWVDEYSPGDTILPISVAMEQRLSTMAKADKQEELEVLELQSAIPQSIVELRKSLGLISFFTVGEQEVREWTIRQGTKAPDAAAVIHKDLQKTFIQAQVTKYDDIVDTNGDAAVLKQTGKIQSKGAKYEVEDGDVVLFKAGAAKR